MIKQLDVGGVPTLLGSTTERSHAGLVFRVGSVDEPLARRGVTHLVEHLALHAAGVADYHRHLTDTAEYTIFYTSGTEAEIVAFLNGVCAALRNLPTGRLALEKDVLRAEANGRGAPYNAAMPMWRYGARDYGMTCFPEWGLPGLGSKDVRDWVARYFTRENAALWVTGEGVPQQLDLSLPAGSPMPTPKPSSALARTPAWFEGSDNVAVWDAVMPHGAAAAVFSGVLERTMFRTLRQKAGLSYAVTTDYTPFAGNRAVVTAVADALPEKQEQVVDALIGVLADMRDGQIDDADVDTVAAQQAAALVQAEQEGRLLVGQAFSLLAGRPVQSGEEAAAEVSAVTRDEVAAVAAQAWETGLLMAPGEIKREGFTPVPKESAEVVAGTEYISRDEPADRLIIGDGGVSLVTRDSTATVRYADCAILRTWPDGARQLVGYDGFIVHIEPTLYADVAAPAIRRIDGRVPDGERVALPPRDPAQIPRPKSAQGQPGRSIVARLAHLLRRTPS